MADVTIAIPTFRRPKGLARLLDSLAKLETSAAVTVLVGDNDGEGRQGLAVCEAVCANGYRWPLDAIVVAERGISQNRNALVAHALARPQMEILVMLDDDEWVPPGWLDALLGTQSRFRADAVEGRVLAIFKDGTTHYYEGVTSDRGPSGLVDLLQSTANVLVTRRALEQLTPPYFDPQFALSGGEDKDFFVRLKGQGARLAWSADAFIHAEVPESREGIRWALRRAYRAGNTDMRVFLKHHGAFAPVLGEIGKIGGALLLSPLMTVIFFADANRRRAALRRFFRAAGKLAALFGSHYQEYSVIHGD